MNLHKLKIGDRVHTPDGDGTIKFFEGAFKDIVGVDSDHAGPGYSYMYLEDGEDNLLTINKHHFENIRKIGNSEKLMKE